jgi:hypothetical protein
MEDRTKPTTLTLVSSDGDGVESQVERALSSQCSARSKQTGLQCRRRSIPGGSVCHIHGGAAPQVQAVALERLRATRDLALTKLEESLADLDGFDPRVLLDIVTRLTDKVELLEGRATERTESRSEVDVREARVQFTARLEDLRQRAELVESLL